MRSHQHDLDGTLHPGCPECERIERIRVRARVALDVDRALDAQSERASRTNSNVNAARRDRST